MFISRSIPRLLATAALAALTFAGAKAQSTAAPIARLSAETANLAAAPGAVRIDILAWSTDEDRSQFVDAWNLVVPTGARSGAAGARGGGAGRGAQRGAAGEAPESAAGQARGRGARGGRGGPPAGAIATPAAAPRTPAGTLAAALQAADGVGYLWSSESVGYALRYAYRMTQGDGSVRIVLATDRRLGSLNGSWKPATGVPDDYSFTVIELRLDPAMRGEGKTSLTGKVSIDAAANTIALEDYAVLPVTLKNVRPAHP